jgi:mono/diheme cytochrome c family protein
VREMMAPSSAPKMLAFKDKLSDADIDAVLAYIKDDVVFLPQDAHAEVTTAGHE